MVYVNKIKCLYKADRRPPRRPARCVAAAAAVLWPTPLFGRRVATGNVALQIGISLRLPIANSSKVLLAL